MNDKDFLLANIGDFEADDCSSEDSERIKELLKKDEFAKLEESFQEARGQLQMQLQGYYIGANRMQGIYDLVENSELRKTHEVEKIESTAKSELWSNLRRRSVVTVLVVGIVGSIAYYWTAPQKVSTFKPIRHLALETISMIEDGGSRMDFHISYPDADLPEDLAEDMPEMPADPNDQATAVAEVQEYLSHNPLLDFEVRVLPLEATNWRVIGASVFDYDGVMVAVVRFESNDALREGLFQYAFKGNMEELPKSEIGVVKADGRALSYQAYGSDMVNLIASQQNEAVLSLIVGSRDVSELARIAATTP